MSERKGKLDEARRWGCQARVDLERIDYNLAGGHYDLVACLSQQAAEKALKALGYYLGERPKVLHTHSTAVLIDALAPHVPELAAHATAARELELHYVPSRYPSGLQGGYPAIFYTREIAEDARRKARAIAGAVLGHFAARGFRLEEDPKGGRAGIAESAAASPLRRRPGPGRRGRRRTSRVRMRGFRGRGGLIRT